jgi:Ser/Thr protein kinase RdoA (MazF antagonist)
VSPHGQFYLKRKPSIPLVAREVRVLHTLAEVHLPVALPLLTNDQLPYVERLDTLVGSLRSTGMLPQALIHRDLHPRNMLFQDGHLSGVLDFDLMMRGPRIFDPCYCATSMLVVRFANEADRAYWFGLLRAVFAGYCRFVPLTAEEQSGIFTMVAVIHLIFILYWLRAHRPDAALLNQGALFWLHQNRQGLTHPDSC